MLFGKQLPLAFKDVMIDKTSSVIDFEFQRRKAI
jgi:hypothetical protein